MVQLIVAPDEVMDPDVTALIAGGVVSGGASVVNIESAEVCKFPA